jgi:hypothetical protein
MLPLSECGYLGLSDVRRPNWITIFDAPHKSLNKRGARSLACLGRRKKIFRGTSYPLSDRLLRWTAEVSFSRCMTSTVARRGRNEDHLSKDGRPILQHLLSNHAS